MFDTLLLRPPLHHTSPNYTSLHFIQLNFTTFIDTSLPLMYTSLLSHLALHIYISCRSVSRNITKLDIYNPYLQTHERERWERSIIL
jgi:hypothetical protein